MRAFLLVLLLSISLQATAQSISLESITIDQLRQKLAASASTPSSQGGVPIARLQDAILATRIDSLQLSERLTSATLAGILAQHPFGPRTQQALHLLADRSALLDPPASELPNLPAPGTSQQLEMLEAASAFVYQTLSHLPNFFATRTTKRFYGVPPEWNKSGMPVQLGLHSRGTYSREITYRNGRELVDPMQHPRTTSMLPQPGFESWGEFGPEPAVILTDLAAGKIAFHHWENGPLGAAAVYRYSIPAAESHYEVNYACNGSTSFHAQPGYHGTLALDPASGAILRLTIQADWKPGDPISHVASVIEYGPVKIGGQTYICPLRSLAFSIVESSACTQDMHNLSVVHPMFLNRTTFSDYHRLASTHTILPDPSAAEQAPRQ